MNSRCTSALLVSLLALAGCSGSPPPEVAVAYGKKWGAETTSRFSPCPDIKGVWHLQKPSEGSFLDETGETVAHRRWHLPQLFGQSVYRFIAIETGTLGTMVYGSDAMPGFGVGSWSSHARKSLSDVEMPCVGHGWRQVAITHHSRNAAAARVLKLVPEKLVKIAQTDFVARTAGHELLLATRIDYEGTGKDGDAIKDGYWHFVKMARLHENPKDQGFKP